MSHLTNDHNEPTLSRRLDEIDNILVVLSGKGGVGKSSVSVQLALTLLSQRQDAKVGILDIDLTGPSIPRMLGLQGKSVHQSTDGWIPVQTNLSSTTDTRNQDDSDGHESNSRAGYGGILKCMSIGFLLKDPKDSVVWRGPKKNAMIKQFLSDVRWGKLDWLIIDTPPGTSDEHISLVEQLSPILASSANQNTDRKKPHLSSVLVTTPQAVSVLDVSKEYDFTIKTGLKVIGLIENMSGYLCPHCDEIQYVFGRGGGESFCQRNNDGIKKDQDSHEKLKFLGRVPIEVEFMKLMDQAMDEEKTHDDESNETHKQEKTVEHSELNLVDRYLKTTSSKIFKEICLKIIGSLES